MIGISRQPKAVVLAAVKRLKAKRRSEHVCLRDPTVRLHTPAGQREPDRVPHGEPIGQEGLCAECRAADRESARRSREKKRRSA